MNRLLIAALIALFLPLSTSHGAVLVGFGASGGTPAGTLLLGNNNTTTSTGEGTYDPGRAFAMCHTAQATATITTAYFYDRLGYETDPVKVCVWNSSGTLLGCSPAISMRTSPGWASAAWSGPSLTQGTSYCIGFIPYTGQYAYTLEDASSPALPATADVANSYATPTDIGTPNCTQAYGSYTIYVTN